MKTSVPVNHNFYEEAPILESDLGKTFNVKKSGVKVLQHIFSSVYELKLGAEQLKQVKIFKFIDWSQTYHNVNRLRSVNNIFVKKKDEDIRVYQAISRRNQL